MRMDPANLEAAPQPPPWRHFNMIPKMAIFKAEVTISKARHSWGPNS